MTGENLHGMNVRDAREYILGFISTKKLCEKKLAALDLEFDKWKARERLALDKGEEVLAQGAQRQWREVDESRQKLQHEINELGRQIKSMIAQLPGLAARERTIDPDLLEQELLIAAGYMLGDEDKAASDRRFSAMEKEAAGEAALEKLKQKMSESAGNRVNAADGPGNGPDRKTHG